MNKEELINAIEIFLIEKEPRKYSKREDIKNWVDNNYEVKNGELTKKKFKSDTLSFFYF